MSFDLSPEERLQIQLHVAARYGFAVPNESRTVPTTAQRAATVRSQGLIATTTLNSLREWLNDEESSVRTEARDSLRRTLYLAFTAEQAQEASAHRRVLNWPARRVKRLVAPRVDEDRLPPWWAEPVGVRGIRRLAAVVGLLLAVGSAVAAAHGSWLLTLILAAASVTTGIGDAAFASAVGLRSVYWPWFACVMGHLDDLIVLVGLLVFESLSGYHHQSLLLSLGALATLMSSFVRVSALQAGLRLWANPWERLIRWGALLAYVIAMQMGGHTATPAAVAFGILVTTSVGEFVQVLMRARQLRPLVNRGVVLTWNKEQLARGFDTDPDSWADADKWDVEDYVDQVRPHPRDWLPRPLNTADELVADTLREGPPQ